MKNTESIRAALSVVFFCVVLVGVNASAGADEIVLANGDIIHGTITEQTDELIVLEHPDLGTFKIPTPRVKSFSFDAQESEPGVVEQPESIDDIPETLLYMPEFNFLNDWAAEMKKKGFEMSVNLSLDGSWGNTNEQSFRLGAALGRKTNRFRMDSDLKYYNKTESSETTDNKLSVGYRKDWLRPDSRWFNFYESRYDFDEFESWRHRLTGHGGAGYNLVDTQRWSMNLRAGPGARKEWESKNDDIRFEGVTGANMTWRITKRQTLNGHFSYYPVLTDFNDYRTRSGVDWRFFMSRDLNLSFLVGLDHEYQSIVDPGSDKNDTRAYMGVQYDF